MCRPCRVAEGQPLAGTGRFQRTKRIRRSGITASALIGVAVLLAACGGAEQHRQPATTPPSVRQSTSRLKIPQVPPVELGRRLPGKPMTSDNMPFFDTITYCERTTEKSEKLRRGPLYEACVQDQEHYRGILAETIDAGKFDDDDTVHCAEASRTAYQGMWYCLNGQEF